MKKNVLLFLLLIVSYTFVHAQCLSGTYKIGGAGADYATIKAAAEALKQNDVCGPVNFKIADGTYEESISLDSITGTSLTNQVIFESASKDSSKVIVKSIGQWSFYINSNYITLKGLGISDPASTASNSSQVKIGTEVKNTTITNCYFQVTGGAIDYTFHTEHPNLVISNNNFQHSGQAIHSITLKGSFSTLTFGRNITISNNIIKGAIPIDVVGADSLYITGNTMLDAHGPAIAVQECGEVFISKNEVFALPGQASYGIGLYGCYKSQFIRYITNNYLHGGLESGIMIGFADNCRIYHNTIDLTAVQAEHAGIILDLSDNSDIKNNLINMQGIGKAIQIKNPIGLTIDYNNYHTNGMVLFSAPGEDFLDLNQWQTGKGYDQHSFTYEPQFASGFHLQDYNLNNRGTSTFVTDDFEGDPRSATPDMGADEFSVTALPVDGGLAKADTNLKYCDNSPKQVIVKLYNNGSSALTSATIKWTFNNAVQSDFNYTGSIVSGSYAYVTLGTITSKGGNELIKAYISLANGVSETNKRNDTCTVRNLKAAMSGAYTIGGSNSSFKTFGEAITYLKKNGVCGSVMFTIKKGTYSGAFSIDSIAGSSSVNTITFQSETTNFSDVQLESVGVTGRYITFKYVTFTGGASTRFAGNITYDHVRFALYFSGIISSELSTNISYTNCRFDCSLKCTSPTLLPANKKLLIENCSFFGNSGIFVESIDSVFIRKNKLTANTTGATSPNWGISLNGCKDVEVSNNYISGDYMQSMKISSCGSVNMPVLIANNSIIGGQQHSDNLVTISSVTNFQFVYNTCIVQYYDMFDAKCLTFHNVDSTTFEVKNNIFVNYGKGTAAAIYVASQTGVIDHNIYYTKDVNTFSFGGALRTFEDYKLASGFDQHSLFGNPGFLPPPQSNFTNDALRGNGIPLSITKDIEDKLRDAVHPTAGAFESKPDTAFTKKDKDLAIASVDTTFSIGSNLVSVKLKNKKITPPHPYVVYQGSIDTIDVSYKWNDSSWVNEQWIGKLNIGDSIDYSFTPSVFVPKGKTYTLVVKATIHGNYQDLNTTNNLVDAKIRLPLNGRYTIGGTNPDFATPDIALKTLKTNHELSAVTFAIRPGTYDLPIIEGTDTVTLLSDPIASVDIRLNCSKIHASNITFINMVFNVKADTTVNKYEEMGLEINSQKISILSSLVVGEQNGNGTYPNGLCFVNSSNVQVRGVQFKNLQSALIYNSVKGLAGITGTWSGTHEIAYNNFRDCKFAFRIYSQSNGSNYELDIKDSIQVFHNFFETEQNVMLDNTKIFMNFYNNHLRNNGISLVVKNVNNGFPIYNNFFASFDTNLSDTTRVKFIQTKNQLFFHNSIWGSMELENSTNLTMKNNAIYSEKNPVLIWDQASEFKSDYNDYYTYGKVLAKKHTAPNAVVSIPDFDSLKIVTQQDQHSVNWNPYYDTFYSLYSNSPFLKGKGVAIPFITTDIDESPRSTTAPSIGADEIGHVQEITWPGDANADSKVSNQDLLSIGLYNGQTGEQRFPVSDDWKSVYCSNWVQQQYNQANMKHADCNGDGKVDSLDINAISKNFGLIHMTNQRIVEEERIFIPGNDLYFIMNNSKSSYNVNEEVEVEVWLGKAILPTTDVYGISFDVVVPTTSFVAGSLDLNLSGSWLKTSNTNLFTLSKKQESEGRSYGAEVRNDHTNISGYGKIGTFKFLSSGTKPGEDVYLKFQNVKLVDAQGKTLVVNPHNNSATNYKGDVTTQLDENDGIEKFTLAPSITAEQTVISYSLLNEAAVSLEVYNIAGQLMHTLVQKKQTAGNYSVQFNLSENKLPAGVYVVRLVKGEDMQTLKLVITK